VHFTQPGSHNRHSPVPELKYLPLGHVRHSVEAIPEQVAHEGSQLGMQTPELSVNPTSQLN
jgi:hypothetical protein